MANTKKETPCHLMNFKITSTHLNLLKADLKWPMVRTESLFKETSCQEWKTLLLTVFAELRPRWTLIIERTILNSLVTTFLLMKTSEHGWSKSTPILTSVRHASIWKTWFQRCLTKHLTRFLTLTSHQTRVTNLFKTRTSSLSLKSHRSVWATIILTKLVSLTRFHHSGTDLQILRHKL